MCVCDLGASSIHEDHHLYPRLFQTHLKVVSPLLVGLTFSCHPTTSLKLYLQLHTSSSSRIFLDLLMEPPADKGKLVWNPS